MAGVVALMTACSSGGGSNPSASPTASSAQTVAYQKLLVFSQCMRSHGVPNFPDPSPGGSIPVSQVNLKTAQAQAAIAACRSKLPGGGGPTPAQMEQAVNALLKFAQCMRSHGVSDFPDPAIVDGTVKLDTAGLNLKTPQAEAAQSACQSVLPR